MVTNCPVFYNHKGEPAEVVEVSPGPEVVEVSPGPEVVEVSPRPEVVEISPEPEVVEISLPHQRKKKKGCQKQPRSK